MVGGSARFAGSLAAAGAALVGTVEVAGVQAGLAIDTARVARTSQREGRMSRELGTGSDRARAGTLRRAHAVASFTRLRGAPPSGQHLAMPSLRHVVPLLLLLAPIACADDKENPINSDPSTTSTTGATATGSDTGPTTGEDTTSTDATTTPTTGSPTSSPTGDPTGATDTTAMDATATDATATDGTSTSTSTSETGTSETGVAPADCSGDAPHVRFETNLGAMVVELDAVNAPNTVANFIEYVEAGFYDGTIFHRVIDNFVLQGGGFTPGLVQKGTNPPIALEISPALKHVDGAIAMARTNDPNSATSQFYICDGPQDFLDGDYAVFGVLVDGFDVRDAISAVPVNAMDVPVDDVIVTMAYCVAGI